MSDSLKVYLNGVPQTYIPTSGGFAISTTCAPGLISIAPPAMVGAVYKVNEPDIYKEGWVELFQMLPEASEEEVV